VKLSGVIDELVEERGLDRDVLSSIISEGMLAAYMRKFPDLILKAEYDKKTDEIKISVQKEVVAAPVDEEAEISVRKARHIDKDLEVGASIWLPFEGKIGRIEILRAKQIIASRIRAIESEAVYNEFKPKEDTIVHGVVHKIERSGISIKVQDTLAFLPKSLTIPTDKFIVGYPIRALLKEVLTEPRNENQLILDRASESFLIKLFELEIPEVFENLVEIKKAVRAPGYKSKVVVVSNDPNIDPVGTCVGVGGVRIKPILKELEGEKIDVIAWVDSKEDMVKSSLKPAVINRVELVDDENANIWLEEDQRSLAIGKMGQNISLASRLVDMNLHIVQGKKEEKNQEMDDALDMD
jgi:transcription termination/antitermination protein NusA